MLRSVGELRNWLVVGVVLVLVGLLIGGVVNTYFLRSYSFFVAGHAYGQIGNDEKGLYPPFVDEFSRLRSDEKMKFGFLTGDIVYKANSESWDAVDEQLNTLTKPVYFAVGNHDVADRKLFERRYGETYFSFEKGEDLFVVLDSNLDPYKISGEQLDFLKETLQSYRGEGSVFVFIHHVLWWDKDNKYGVYKLNAGVKGSNFFEDVMPLLKGVGGEVYVFAGDVGGALGKDVYLNDREENVYLIASGMGKGDGDGYLIVDVYDDGGVKVKFEAFDRLW